MGGEPRRHTIVCARALSAEDWGEGDSDSCPGAEDNYPPYLAALVPEHSSARIGHRGLFSPLHHQQQLINPEPHPLIDSRHVESRSPPITIPVLN